MQKNYEDNPKKAGDIKADLLKKYPEIFEKYEINDLSSVQVCNLAEFLIKEHPEKYDKTQGTRMNYENNKDLQNIYAIIDPKENKAIMLNTSQEGKIPEGEFGTYDLEKENPKFTLTNEKIKEKIRDQIEKYAKDTITEQEKEQMLQEVMPKKLDDIDKMATMGERNMDEKVRKAVDKKIDEKNAENGKTKEQRNALEQESKKKETVTMGEKKGQENSQEVPEDVAKACSRLGITNIKAFMYASGNEFATKTDIPYVNKNGGNVLIIRAKSEDATKGTDRYFVFQDGRLCVPGNKDEEIDQVARKSTQNSKNGNLIKPVEIDDEEQYVEYEDSQGLDIKEKLAESMNLSVQDLEQYKREIQIELEKYSEELYKIDEAPFVDDRQRDELYKDANKRFNANSEKIAQKYGINLDNVKSINFATDQKTEEKVNEVEEPDDGLDERGKPLH